MSSNDGQTITSESNISRSGPSPFLENITKACEAFVEDYRNKCITKAFASKSILNKLSHIEDTAETQPISEDERDAAFADFFDQLETIDSVQRSGFVEGSAGDEHRSARPSNADEQGVDEPCEVVEQNTTHSANKRGRDEVDDTGDRGDSPKRPIDPSLFPFGQDVFSSQLDDELKLTLKLKENYLRDVKFVKTQIASQPDLPDVPPTIWDDIVRDAFVDFDKIVSSHFSLEGDSREVKQLGDFEVITGGSSKSKRTIATQADWFLSWNKYKRGVIYLYPHRVFELQSYEDYMLGQFTAAPDHLIINLDKAIRSRVGRANNLKLSSFDKFSNLYTSQVLLAARGTNSNPKGQSVRTQPRLRDEICLRWNKDGKCDFIGCRFKHICSICKSNGHTAPNCPRGSTHK
jgi:hypothetical protein